MRVLCSKLARKELDAAPHYDEIECEGLGKRFRKEVRKAAKRIADYPEGWSVERGDVRKCLLHTVPDTRLDSMEVDHIVILAVAHRHRKPDDWSERTKP